MTETQTDDPLLPVDPVLIDTSFTDTTDPEQEPDDTEQAKEDLDERSQEDFIGLMYLGHLEHECTVASHRFLLRTPSQDDRLDMGSVHRPYLNTMSELPAWQLVLVSAYTRRIDSMAAPEPLNNSISGVRTRFEWVRRSIASQTLIELLYEECMSLAARERKCVEYLDALGEASA